MSVKFSGMSHETGMVRIPTCQENVRVTLPSTHKVRGTPRRSATLVWFDPGMSTGCVLLSVRAAWIAGHGAANWAGLGESVTFKVPQQFGQLSARRASGIGVVRDKADSLAGGILKSGPSLTTIDSLELASVNRMIELMEMWPDAAWGYEDFVPRSANSSRAFLSPVRIFSMLKYQEVFNGQGRMPFVQSASMAKTTATDEMLKRAGLYFAGMPHATDAARHATTFLRNARQKSSVRHRAWPTIFDSHGEFITSDHKKAVEK